MSNKTFPIYTNSCGWNSMLPARRPRPALAQDRAVDYAIIGAGLTGLAVARRLAELDNQASIAICDATSVEEGSSGRNSGFTGSQVLPSNATPQNVATAKAQTLLMDESFKWLCDTIRKNSIECDIENTGTIRGAATEAGEASLRKVWELAKANNIAHRVLSRDELKTRTGSDYYRFGLLFDYGHLLQPAALIRGLADAVPDNVTLYENTPVMSLTRDGKDWLLHCADGIIRARNVVLANNAFIPKFNYLKLRMATIYTYAAITRKLSESEQAHIGQEGNWGLLPCHRLGSTIRRVGEDRLLVRSLYSLNNELDQTKVTGQLHERFSRRWPELSHVDFDSAWGGTTSFTMNGAPWWGKLDDGLFASGGCNGSGIAKGTMLGRNLAELICGFGDPTKIPRIMGTASLIAPEPFRSIGFHITAALESRKAGLEI